MKDIGVGAASRSGGLVALSKCKENNSERDTHKLLTQTLGLGLPIPATQLETEHPDLSIPMLKLSDWFAYILKLNLFYVLTGLRSPDRKREEAILQTFWSKFRLQSPQHEIFVLADAGKIDLSHTVPFALHGDEGRGRRRQAFMVCSFHSLLGRGTAQGREHRASEGRPYAKLELNFLGHTYTTRFLFAALNKKSYCDDNADVFPLLMEEATKDLRKLLTEGLTNRYGERFYGALVHITGDWPFLQKSGSLVRTFNNVDKKANAQNKQAPKGVCHLCRAGQIGYPYEQVETRRPHWLSTMYTSSPFRDTPPFLDLPHVKPEAPALWAFDIWHCWHLGVGRNFVGSVLAIYSTLEEGGSVEDRFDSLTKRYRIWCQTQKRTALLTKITKESIQWPNTKSFPTATWHKGDITRVMMLWIQQRAEEEDFSDHALLPMVGQAACAINECFRILYRSPLFLEPSVAAQVAGLGLRFLRRYGHLAASAQEASLSLFVMMPKTHPLHHIFLELLWSSEKGTPRLSPLAVSVQCDEDFIGRPSRLSRRVTGKRPVLQRVVERYLQSCYSAWEDAGYIRVSKR